MRYWRFKPWMLNGHSGNVSRPVKKFIRRGVNHGLVCTSTTGGVHSPTSFHHPDRNGIGHAADMGLPGRMVGTNEGRRRIVAFQRHEARNPTRLNELFGPDNAANVKNGRVISLAEGTALENQHDNHVHGAPRR